MQLILTSRKFWAAAVSLILICAGAFLPKLPDLSQPATDLAVLISAYICGTAIEGHKPLPLEEALRSLIHSRKFWASLAGLAILLLRALVPDFPLPDEQISAIILTLSAYIFGTGLQDSLSDRPQSIV